MRAIESQLDTQSDGYLENYAAMAALVEDLNTEMDKSLNERSEKSLNRLAENGKLPTTKKLELLLDPNTPFLEIAPLAAKGMYDGKIHKAGIVIGIGMVAGKEVLVSANDPTDRKSVV